jgi:hypothetical protein
LDDPDQSAQTIRSHLDTGGGTAISEKLQRELDDRLSRQQAAWNRLIGSLAKPVGPYHPRHFAADAVADQL